MKVVVGVGVKNIEKTFLPSAVSALPGQSCYYLVHTAVRTAQSISSAGAPNPLLILSLTFIFKDENMEEDLYNISTGRVDSYIVLSFVP